tara:strand:+ start:407 stop:658 length:252 start_codon:yes stop_codon:yes gene_type:complete
MLEFLFWISAKKIVVAFAFIGAILVTIAPKASKFGERKTNSGSNQEGSPLAQALEKILVRVGYAFVGLSITLFIIAGFIVDLK